MKLCKTQIMSVFTSLALASMVTISCKNSNIDEQGTTIDLEAYKKSAQGSYMDFAINRSGDLDLSLPITRNSLSLTGNSIEAFEILTVSEPQSCDNNVAPIQGKVVDNRIKTKVRLQKTCDYNLRLKVGTAKSSGGVDTIFYHNASGTNIPKIGADKDSIKINILVYRTEAAKQLGFPGRDLDDNTPSIPPQNNIDKDKPQEDKPQDDTPRNDNQKINLSQDPQLNSKSGRVKLSSLFKKKYLVVEFSESWCGYCRILANKMHNQYRQILENGKCENALFTNNLAAWNQLIPSATSVQAHSYSFGSSTISNVSKILGIRVSAYPTTAILENDNGNLKVLSTQTGGLPSNFMSICR